MKTDQPGTKVTKNISLLLRYSRWMITGGLLALLPACSSINIQGSRAAATTTAGPFRHVIVVGTGTRPEVREGFENDLVAFLSKRGVSGLNSYSRFSLDQLKGEKEKVRTRITATGADSVLFVRLTDREDILAGGPPPTLGDMDMAAVDESRYNALTSPGGAVNSLFVLHARLYQISDGNPVWNAQVRAIMKEDSDSIVFMRSVAEKIVRQMRKDRVVP